MNRKFGRHDRKRNPASGSRVAGIAAALKDPFFSDDGIVAGDLGWFRQPLKARHRCYPVANHEAVNTYRNNIFWRCNFKQSTNVPLHKGLGSNHRAAVNSSKSPQERLHIFYWQNVRHSNDKVMQDQVTWPEPVYWPDPLWTASSICHLEQVQSYHPNPKSVNRNKIGG